MQNVVTSHERLKVGPSQMWTDTVHEGSCRGLVIDTEVPQRAQRLGAAVQHVEVAAKM